MGASRRPASILLLVVALVLFVVAGLVALGDATFRGEASLVPLGLAALAAAFLLERL